MWLDVLFDRRLQHNKRQKHRERIEMETEGDVADRELCCKEHLLHKRKKKTNKQQNHSFIAKLLKHSVESNHRKNVIVFLYYLYIYIYIYVYMSV